MSRNRQSACEGPLGLPGRVSRRRPNRQNVGAEASLQFVVHDDVEVSSKPVIGQGRAQVQDHRRRRCDGTARERRLRTWWLASNHVLRRSYRSPSSATGPALPGKKLQLALVLQKSHDRCRR